MKSEKIRRIASENGLDERNGWYEIDGIKVTNFIVTDVLVFREPTSNRDAFLDVALNVDGTECHAFIEATTGDFIGQILRQVFYAQVTKRAAKDIQSETPLSSITKSKLGKLLAERRIIPESAEKRSASAKLNGVRYLPIDLSALKAAAVRY